mmetsp:Transcript_9603/g.10331  ORF Transcript_9603/g.10331 Transcript_9603/m.10331 type:complete len:345 (+) Transcript_9603:89-1123(+)
MNTIVKKVNFKVLNSVRNDLNCFQVRSVSSLEKKHFMRIGQLSNEELEDLLQLSIHLKTQFKTNHDDAKNRLPLKGKSMSMIFQKRSTRTRVSTETGIYLLGGHALMLGPQDIQLGVNETMQDTSLVLSRFNDIILARVFAHQDVEDLAKYSSVPVINALSDKYHPLQTLADLMTLKEHFNNQLQGKTVAWIGDGNNVLHDLLIGSLKVGMNVNIATPKDYRPDPDVLEEAFQIAKASNLKVNVTDDPKVAIKGANVVVTDTWISMGQEAEAKKRKLDFTGYQIDTSLMKLASSDAVFLHCLPRKQEEVTDEVFYSKQSLVFPEAENRMWTVMAVTLRLLGLRF